MVPGNADACMTNVSMQQAAAETKKAEWVKAQRKKETKGRSEMGKESVGLRRQLKAAENAALSAQSALASAERDANEAARVFERYDPLLPPSLRLKLPCLLIEPPQFMS